MKPIYLILNDHQFPLKGDLHVRPNARALLENAEGKFAFHHLLATDKFGLRDYLETPGGGLNDDETPEQAVVREVEEETGCRSTIICPIGIIEDDYHLIQRHNINHYYYLSVSGKGMAQFTTQEKTLIEKTYWLTLEEAKAWYLRLPDQGIAQLIKQRELPIIEWMVAYKNSKG